MNPLRTRDSLILEADMVEELRELSEYEMLDTAEEMSYISMEFDGETVVDDNDLLPF